MNTLKRTEENGITERNKLCEHVERITQRITKRNKLCEHVERKEETRITKGNNFQIP